MKIGTIGKIYTGTWAHDEIVEGYRVAQIVEVEEDDTIWAQNEDGDEFEIDATDFEIT